MKMDLIIYHNSCPDGWAAAYICKKRYPEAELLPLNHGLSVDQLEAVFEKSRNKDVIMVDYSLSTRESNDWMWSITKSFQIYDHHKTAQATLENAPYAIFDMTRSGAGLAWDYMFGKDSLIRLPIFENGVPTGEYLESETLDRPWWVDYTEDQDLWNWKLESSHSVNAFLMTMPRTEETWDDLTKAHDRYTAEQAGLGVRQYIEYYTRSVLEQAQKGVLTFEGNKHYTGVLNIPYVGVSEAGNALCKAGYDVGLLWFERGDGVIQFSLRSLKEGKNVDVSAIAKAYGGGGHQNAAGFQLGVEEGRNLVDVVLGRKNMREALEALAPESGLNVLYYWEWQGGELVRRPLLGK
jgi:uncharacterized protein